MTARFPYNPANGRLGLELSPSALISRTVPRRTSLRGLPFIDAMPGNDPWPASVVDSLVQFKLVGDPYPGAFAQGHTLRNSESLNRFVFSGQSIEETFECKAVTTTLSSTEGCRVEHRLSWRKGDHAIEVSSTFINASNQPVTLELLSSFSLGGITPFDAADAPGRLRVHRFRSGWSAEARLQTETVEALHLERSWSGAGAFSERFGQVGSMPVRKWFPFVAVEDTQAGVIWGAQLAWAGSWQLEVYRQHDDVCLSGGLADREFGHWMKTVSPGETFSTPPAFLSCVHGDLDQLCDRLTAMQARAAQMHPAVEYDLPIVFNEWCTTWGEPTHQQLETIARRLHGSEVRYVVIDAGWYKSDTGNWDNGHGDWRPSPRLFPHGLAAAAAAIRAQGLIPGLWFEMETVGQNSIAFSLVDLLLQRDSLPVTVRGRRFWDLNNRAAIDYLTEHVVDLLQSCGFGYLKVDYNETIGLGCDHYDALGEGLRLQIEGVYRFFELIRARLPELVIENCSSGGHRLEPSMLARSAMSSFSDAHELVEIPIIAANLHRLMLPRQEQIWAVLHRSDSDRRLIYSLAATFLGRMCLSGEIADLSETQWALVLRAQQLYGRAVPIIKDGTSRRFGNLGESWRYPQGWQAVVRVRSDRQAALVILHVFAGSVPELTIPLPGPQPWTLAEDFADRAFAAEVDGSHLRLRGVSEFSAGVYLLTTV